MLTLHLTLDFQFFVIFQSKNIFLLHFENTRKNILKPFRYKLNLSIQKYSELSSVPTRVPVTLVFVDKKLYLTLLQVGT